MILSLYKIPVTREPSRWPTSLKNSQSIHPPPPLFPTPSKISEAVKIGMTTGLKYVEIGYTIVKCLSTKDAFCSVLITHAPVL